MKRIFHIKHLLSAVLTAVSVVAGYAQAPKNSVKITGTLVTDQNKPVEFATISLLRAKDSSLVKGALGNDAGAYTLEKVDNGTYIIKATAVGYNKGFSKPFTVNADTKAVTVPAISMPSTARALGGVTVTSTRPLIETKIDRTVMNVENSVLATGNTAMDILERAPGVSVDKDDNISLQGKQGVTVMINDKLTYLSAAQLATLLRSTDGSNIASIELITNPSAKYDAAGNSGIINIKLKKNRQVGTSGSLIVGAGYGNNFKDNQSFSLNRKQGKLNAFLNLNHNDYKTERMLNIQRVVENTGTSTFFNQDNLMKETGHNNSFRLGADYDISKKNTLGFVVNGYANTELDNTPSTSLIGSSAAVVDSFLRSNSNIDMTFKNFAANVNDRWQIDTLGQELAIDVDYSKFRNSSLGTYNTDIFRANGSPLHPPTVFRNDNLSAITIKSAKADYGLPLTKTIKLELGAKYSDVKTDNDLVAQIPNGSGGFVNDYSANSNSNHFIYSEKIAAGYFNINKTWKNTSAQFGLRAENTDAYGYLVGKPDKVDREYLNFFPSVFINQKLGKKNEVGLSYSRRIDRPSYDDLNPFIYFLDRYTYNKGNPFLQPQYTDNYEMRYNWNHTINVTVGYSRTTDVITQIILTDTVTKASYQTNLNLQVQNAYSFNLNSPFTITKWWTGNVNFNLFYLGFKSPDLLGAKLSNGQTAYQGKLSQTITFLKTWKFETFANYKSALTFGIYDVRPQYNIDAGVSHSFANKRANIKLSMNDVFNTRTNNVNSMYQSVNLRITQKGETRVARISLTYNFGNTKIKARDHQTGADQESSRVKGAN